ncbi:hypothetical protein BJ878DRAFT_544168 [Calycina marina]|uniref:EDC4-like protein pdc1 beta-propeller domain-containing protein n=1 Tax=Calycina marina TaxID=1763456 RepID=A0A9P7YZE7_9HELO|nr:hypothetical protein BJ878DRAFT_544168 [Calycina marina]
MSGYTSGGGGGDGNKGLDSLLAQLRGSGPSAGTSINLQPSASYGYANPGYFGQPSVSSTIPTPTGYNAQPHHSSAIMSPVETPRIPAANGGAQSSLLNLLKFKPAGSSSPRGQPAPIGTPLPPSREPSISYSNVESAGRNSDLLASFMGTKPTQQESSQYATAPHGSQTSFDATPTSPPVETQNYLLQLLNKPKPSQADAVPQLTPFDTKVYTPPSKSDSQYDVGEITQALEDTKLDLNLVDSTSFEPKSSVLKGKENIAQASTSTQGLFTYVNPFDQLAASSPRINTPKVSAPATPAVPAIQILKRHGEQSDHKRKIDERSSDPSPAHMKRKSHAPSQASSGPPTPLADGRSKIEALIGIGASNKETVAQALSEVGGQASREVDEAIAKAEENLENQLESETDTLRDRHSNRNVVEKTLQDLLAAKTEEEFEETAQVAAQTIKKELDREENSHALDSYPTEVAQAVKGIIDDTAEGKLNDAALNDAPDSWESADADEGSPKEPAPKPVKVYNFPMRPFSSITVKALTEPRATFRDDITMDIARLKKDFDQVDRVLVTASNNFIVYGMSKNGGIRVIRQDDGKDGRLFTDTRDRIFTVVTCTSSADLKESIIGTGISGTVYWALVKDGENDRLDEDNRDHLEMYGFALTPIQSMDNESPGGVLKTRARKSSTHPDFFAVGRGKFIHILWPNTIMKSFLKTGKDRSVDTEKYLSQHILKVNTGKAGKDFSFSEDDSTIVSLDKAGRVKFWDVRSLTKNDGRGNPLPHSAALEIKDPIITLTTTAASEKSWPTSVLLVDKIRPYQRGGPLRYLIVGMKQNHSLQLWDLALGKPVQEIHLPHGKESDAVCSVVYHAQTGMIVIGHPTRNSIYFLHLSAPKYNMSKSMTQADFMQGIVDKSDSIPSPDSTAVISGMREYSFENKGLLRGLDILQTPSASSDNNELPTSFELYIMHSKGVTYLAVKQSDLGWTRDNKVINGVAAEKEGVITMESLKEIPGSATSDISEPAPTTTPLTRIATRNASKETPVKESSKKSHHAESTAGAVPAVKTDIRLEKKDSNANGATPGKGKRRKATSTSDAPVVSQSTALPVKAVVLDPFSNTRALPLAKPLSSGNFPVVSGISQGLNDSHFKDFEVRLSADLMKLLDGSLERLSQDIKSDRRVQTAVADSHQEAVLRLVAATLDENVEATLTRIVDTSIGARVVPSMTETIVKTMNAQIGAKLPPLVSSTIAKLLPGELQKVLPDIIVRSLQQPQLLKLMSESLAKSVAFDVQDHFAAIIQNTVTPAFSQLSVSTTQKIAADVHRQASEQIATIQHQREADSVKIDHLLQTVASLTETISTMAAAQAEFQERTLQQLSREGTRPSHSTSDSNALAPAKQKSEAEKLYDAQLAEVSSLMEQQDFNGAAMAWLHSARVNQMFVDYFVQFRPDFLRGLNTIVLLTIGSIISEGIDDKLMERRMDYLDVVLNVLTIQINDCTLLEDARAHIPVIVATFIQRLEHLFMIISNVDAHDNSLKEIQRMVAMSKRIIDATRTPMYGGGGTGSGSRGRHY